MLDGTITKLIRLLGPGYSEDLRVAAAKVLGEVATHAPELHEALTQALDDPSAAVRLQAIATLGQLRIEQALPKLLARVSAGGPESELAALAVARLGAKGTQALQNLMHEVAPGLRRRLAASLAFGGTRSASTAAVDALLDNDPGVVNAAVSSLTREIPAFTASQRRALTDQVLELVKPKKSQSLSPDSESALIRVLAALADPRSEKAFWNRIGVEHPPELRAAALQALGTLPPPRDKTRLRELVRCACDRDFRVAAPALMILKGIPVPQASVKEWVPLLDAPDPAVRRFGIEKLGDRDDADVAKALLGQLDHPDPVLRQEAMRRLAETDAGRDLLLEAFLEAPTPEAAWSLARPLARFAGQFHGAFAKLFKQASQYLDADDRRGEALLFLLRYLDADSLHNKLQERAQSLRKKKNYEGALRYFRLLARDPACSEDLRFELAACGLKLSDRSLTAESRSSDPALGQFARILRNPEIEPIERVNRAKWLGPDELFYLGFHFIEGNGQERDFGAEALRLAISRSPRSKIAKDAKNKLRSAGLDTKA
jgi:HEAT repeat protein